MLENIAAKPCSILIAVAKDKIEQNEAGYLND
jgi:hypothetical protein